MCDTRIAGRSARFAQSFVRLGIVPGDGGAWLLPRSQGFAKASELALTARWRIGLVTRGLPDADLAAEARKMALKIVANPPEAVRMTRRLLRQAWSNNPGAVLDMSAAMQAVAYPTDDDRHGLSAMLARVSGKP